ncbi:MAG: adenylate/guanylate cyclase domain-containing protein [Actinomycetota bacterium]
MSQKDPFAGIADALRRVGVSDEEIEAAQREGPRALILLFADRVFVPGAERITRVEAAKRAGIDVEEAAAFWRALGFPDVSDNESVFTEADVDVLRRVVEAIRSGAVDREMALQMTRVMGRAAAQVAAGLVDTVRRAADNNAGAVPELLGGTPDLIDDLEQWLVYVWRRHFAAEAKRAALEIGSEEAGTAVVGFADLVGFSGISQTLDEATLAAAVSSFEATAVDLVSRHRGRVIKMIGDEVMFEAPSAREGAEIALGLVDAFEADEQLPDIRVGLAEGPVTRNQGDLFGTAPNLASRLVDAAYPATVLVSDSIHEGLVDEPGFAFRPVRPQNLKGFGRTRFWVLRREGAQKLRPMWKVPLPLRGIEIAERVEEAVERATKGADET